MAKPIPDLSKRNIANKFQSDWKNTFVSYFTDKPWETDAGEDDNPSGYSQGLKMTYSGI